MWILIVSNFCEKHVSSKIQYYNIYILIFFSSVILATKHKVWRDLIMQEYEKAGHGPQKYTKPLV